MSMEDGLYLIKRGMDLTLGPVKTALLHAYNDHYLQFFIYGSSPAGSFHDSLTGNTITSADSGWADWAHYRFVQPNQMTYLLAHWEDGIDIFGFPDPGVSSGTITNVAICIYMQGKGRSVCRITSGGTNYDYYGALTTDRYIFDWNVTNYARNPRTGAAWTWANLAAGTLKCGMDLRRPFATDWAIPNSSGDPWVYFGKDDRLNILGTRCRYFKVVISYLDGDGVSHDIELWPSSDVYIQHRTRSEADDRIVPMIGNILMGMNTMGDLLLYTDTDGADPSSTTYSYWGVNIAPEVSPGSYAIAFSCRAQYAPQSSNSVGLYAFLVYDGTTYYSSEQSVSAYSSWSTHTITWATNPVTGVAWTAEDIAKISRFGVKLRKTGVTDWVHWAKVKSGQISITKSGVSEYIFDDSDGSLYLSPGGIWIVDYADGRPAFVAGMNNSSYWGGLYIDSGNLISRYASDLSLTIPSFSVPGGIKVSAAWNGYAAAGNSTCKIFIEFNGHRYYGDTVTLNTSASGFQYGEYSWNVSPATGLAWTYDEFAALRFGMEVERTSKNNATFFVLHRVDAEISWQEPVGPTVSYQKMQCNLESVSQIKYPQRPKLKANELIFRLPPGNFIPERAEIMLIRQGKPDFMGIVWTVSEKQNREIEVKAKSQQVLLENRYFPQFFYYARNDLFDSVYTLDDVFSDDLPQTPYYIHFSRYVFPYPFYYHYWYNAAGEIHIASSETPWLGGGIELLQGHETNLGIFFMLNSLPAYGQYADDTLRGIAPLIANRAKFLTNHDPTTNAENDFDETPDYCSRMVSGHGTIFSPDLVGSVRRFQPGNIANLDQYEVSGNDIILPHYSGAFMPLFDHAFDTHLRPGTNDLGAKLLSVPYTFGEKDFAASFSDFFNRLGQEIRFRNSLRDGMVYMDAATEIGKETHLKFIHGKNNCIVKKNLPSDPPLNAVVSSGQIATSWKKSLTCWIAKYVQNPSRDGLDMQEWLDALLTDDPTTYDITQYGEELLLDPGDYIEAQAEDDALASCRAQKIIVGGGKTKIAAGRRLAALDELFGEWRLVNGSVDIDHQIQEKSFSFTGTGGTQTFVVRAADYQDGGWKCRVSVRWNIEVDTGYTADIPAAVRALRLTLNGKVVPPGRVAVTTNSGGAEIVITDYCNVSTSADTTNTLVVALANGLSSTHYRHKITGSISQFRRLEAINNA